MPGDGRSFAVIGLGAFGGTVATELARFGNRVLGIDAVEARVARYADDLSDAIIADGRDEQTLRDAGLGAYDVAVIAIGEDLEANILCTMNAKMIGVKEVWVKGRDRTHHRILSKIGADRVVEPEQEIGTHVAQMLHNPMVRDYMSLGNGFIVVNIVAPERLGGRAVGELDLQRRYELLCLGVMRGTAFIDCDGGAAQLKTDDRLLLLGRRANLRRFADEI